MHPISFGRASAFRRAAIAAAMLAAGPMTGLTALAQPADLPIPAATTDKYPPGVSVRPTAKGPVYTDRRGRTLYGMDMRVLVRWSPDPAFHCQEECAKTWEPLLAPEGSKPNIMFPRGFGDRGAAGRPGPAAGAAPAAAAPAPAQPRPQGERAPGQAALPEGFVLPQRAPDWTIIDGPSGPQWVYKGWHMVYTRKNDRAGSTAHDGDEQMTWNTLKFVPPVPRISAPPGVAPAFANGAYQLADRNGRALFTGHCTAGCTWTPLAAPAASRPLGEWSVNLGGDRPQWNWKGKPVYVSQEDDPMAVPASGAAVRP